MNLALPRSLTQLEFAKFNCVNRLLRYLDVGSMDPNKGPFSQWARFAKEQWPSWTSHCLWLNTSEHGPTRSRIFVQHTFKKSRNPGGISQFHWSTWSFIKAACKLLSKWFLSYNFQPIVLYYTGIIHTWNVNKNVTHYSLS